MRARSPQIAFAALLLLASPARGAESREPRTFDELMESAVKARERGDLERALDLLHRAYRIEPSPGLKNNIARVLEELGKYREAFDEYSQVIHDPGVDPSLRTKDLERIEALRPKLASGWLRLEAAPTGVGILVDGAAKVGAIALSGGEVAVEPGQVVIEASLAAKREALILFAPVRAGNRTVVRADLSAPRPRPSGLSFDGSPADISEVSIDQYRLRTAPAQIATLFLEPGNYRIAVERAGKPALHLTITLAPGSTIQVKDWFAPSATQKDEHRTAQVILTGAGAASAIGGVVLFVLASRSRVPIENALAEQARGPGGVVNQITYADADRLESRARTESTAGAILLGAGVLAVATGIGWWIGAELGE